MTKIWGTSDDLIEVDGDVRGEVDCYDDEVLLICSDGTLLGIKYGKMEMAIWQINVIQEGSFLEGVEQCTSEDADIYSDVALFHDGLKWVYAAKNWEKVK